MVRDVKKDGTHQYPMNFPIEVWKELVDFAAHRGATVKDTIVDSVKDFIVRNNEAELRICREKHQTALDEISRKLGELEHDREEHEAHEDAVADDVAAFIEAEASSWWEDNAPSIGTAITADTWLIKAEGRLDAVTNNIKSRFDVTVTRERLETVFREKGNDYGLR